MRGGDGAGRLCIEITFINDIHACFLLTIKEVSQRTSEALPSIASWPLSHMLRLTKIPHGTEYDFLLAIIRTLQPHDGNRSGVELVHQRRSRQAIWLLDLRGAF
jgi:hypothetical protein